MYKIWCIFKVVRKYKNTWVKVLKYNFVKKKKWIVTQMNSTCVKVSNIKFTSVSKVMFLQWIYLSKSINKNTFAQICSCMYICILGVGRLPDE